jgi:hypothetical protein
LLETGTEVGAPSLRRLRASRFPCARRRGGWGVSTVALRSPAGPAWNRSTTLGVPESMRPTSLHRRHPRGPRPSAMALLGFLPAALGIRDDVRRGHLDPNRRSDPGTHASLPRSDRPTRCLRWGSARPKATRPARRRPGFGGARRLPFRALPPARMGSGCPVPALLRFASAALPRGSRPLQGLLPESECRAIPADRRMLS